MKIDFSAAELFMDYISGETTVENVLRHPAYLAVRRHADLFSTGIGADDVENALQGRKTSFYGMDKFFDRQERIKGLLETIRKNSASWCEVVNNQLDQVFPKADLDITVYPIFGYDMGIGLDGIVCMNVNTILFLTEPYEFLFYIIHEATHVIYERCHPIPALKDISSPKQWHSYFNLWLQNEGFAVYTPLTLRQELGFLTERDYKILSDPALVEKWRQDYLQTQDLIMSETPLERDQYLECCFGDKRITYRMGCELIRRIATTYGQAAVIEAFSMNCDEYFDRYGYLLKL